MKKRIILSSILILLTLGLANIALGTNQTVNNQDDPMTVKNYVINSTGSNENTEWYGTNSVPNEVDDDTNDELQNSTVKRQLDSKRKVAITVIIVISIAIIVTVGAWYYKTKQ